MKKVFILLLIALPFVSCSKKEVFNAENIIPTPKKMIVNDDKLHYIDDITVFKDRCLFLPRHAIFCRIPPMPLCSEGLCVHGRMFRLPYRICIILRQWQAILSRQRQDVRSLSCACLYDLS